MATSHSWGQRHPVGGFSVCVQIKYDLINQSDCFNPMGEKKQPKNNNNVNNHFPFQPSTATAGYDNKWTFLIIRRKIYKLQNSFTEWRPYFKNDIPTISKNGSISIKHIKESYYHPSWKPRITFMRVESFGISNTEWIVISFMQLTFPTDGCAAQHLGKKALM